jgi:hypothetical protein
MRWRGCHEIPQLAAAKRGVKVRIRDSVLSNNVIVHDVREEQQKEDEAHLNEALFHREAQIAAQ